MTPERRNDFCFKVRVALWSILFGATLMFLYLISRP